MAGLRLTVLGCAGSYPGAGCACSGYLVQSDTTTLWLDAGSGTLANLQRHVSIGGIDAVVLSHSHVDHCSDVNSLWVAAKYYERRPPIPVYAPADVPGALAHAEPPLQFHTVADGDDVPIGDLRVRFSRTEHSVETLACRIDGGGRALGYSADSGPAWSLEALGSDLDLALCEATFLQDDEGKAPHMSARQAGRSGREAGVGRLVLTHLAPRVDRKVAAREGAEAFGRDVTVAADHQVFAL